MTLSVTHKFVSAKVDGGDTSLVRPIDWNDNHDLHGQGFSLIARNAAGDGPMADILLGDGLWFDTNTGKIDVRQTALIGFFAQNTAPTGWLKANGALISRTTYATLFGKIGTTFGAGDGTTTFQLPDLRGYFARGWDDGRGIDASRVFGSSQADAVENHTHTASSGGESVDHSHTYSGNTGGRSAAHSHSTWAPIQTNIQHDATSEGDYTVGASYSSQTSGESNDHVHGFSGTTSGRNAGHTHAITVNAGGGGTETRPLNVALLACIKY